MASMFFFPCHYKKQFNTIGYLILLLSILITPVFATQKNYSSLEKNIANKQYTSAWRIAQSLLTQYEGEPRFDYLYALSAIGSQHYNEALFALERVVINSPNIIRPRLELAKVYLQLHNKHAAIKEFKVLLALQPKPNIKKAVKVYLVELTQPKDAIQPVITEPVITGLVSLDVGYDSNVNFGLDNNIITLPLLGETTLSSASLRKKAGFNQLLGQVSYQQQHSKTQAWFASAKIVQKKYNRLPNFDLRYGVFKVGGNYQKKSQHYALSLSYQPIYQGGKVLAQRFVLDLAKQYPIDKKSVFSTGITLEKFDHQQDKLQDKKRLILTTSYGLKAMPSFPLSQQYQFNIGIEQSDQTRGKYFAQNLIGMSGNYIKAWSKQHMSFFVWRLSYRHYKAKHPIYNQRRKDNKLTLILGHQVPLTKHVNMILNTHYSRTQSNLSLYNVNKNQINLGISYSF